MGQGVREGGECREKESQEELRNQGGGGKEGRGKGRMEEGDTGKGD